PSGERTRLSTGPSMNATPLRFASAPIRPPNSATRSTSHVAPNAVPQGVHVALEPDGKVMPRTPLGPSEVCIGASPRDGAPEACQPSTPDVRAAFSSTL